MLCPIYMLTYISLSTSESLAFCLKASWQLLLSSADPSLLWRWKRQTSLPGGAILGSSSVPGGPHHSGHCRSKGGSGTDRYGPAPSAALLLRDPPSCPSPDKVIFRYHVSVQGRTSCDALAQAKSCSEKSFSKGSFLHFRGS